MTPRKKSKIILALDVSSSSTGYAVFEDGVWCSEESMYGVIKQPAKKQTLPIKLVNFRNSINALLRRVKPTDIIIEDVFSSRNIRTLKLLSRYNGVAIEVCRRYLKKDPHVALTSSVRSALGCGRTKEEAFSFICEEYDLDWNFKNMNDVADAMALGLYLHNQLLEKS